jgi:uncharacterized protein (DUF488 family)
MTDTPLTRHPANRGKFPVFTVGHAAHSAEHFTTIVTDAAIEWVVDVRSSPFSRWSPQYNRQTMKEWLASAAVHYSFAGASLGGRPSEGVMYRNGRADYIRMATTEAFRAALRRIARASRTHRIALMCAEADPIECHRFLLIARALVEGGVEVQHILASGRIESHRASEERMLDAVGLRQTELFDDKRDVLSEAYLAQAQRVAFAIGEHVDRSE